MTKPPHISLRRLEEMKLSSAQWAELNGGRLGVSKGVYPFYLSRSTRFNDCFGFRVDSQWIVAKKDWREAKKRSKEQGQHKDRKQNASEKTNGSAFTDDDPDSGAYQEEMDEMRCILYAHGGNL